MSDDSIVVRQVMHVYNVHVLMRVYCKLYTRSYRGKVKRSYSKLGVTLIQYQSPRYVEIDVKITYTSDIRAREFEVHSVSSRYDDAGAVLTLSLLLLLVAGVASHGPKSMRECQNSSVTKMESWGATSPITRKRRTLLTLSRAVFLYVASVASRCS